MNTKTKSILRLLCLALSLVFVLSCFGGCGSESTKDPADETPAEDEKPKEDPKPPKPINLTIGSYNIANGRDVGHDFKFLARDILEKGLDIVGLQEVDINADRSKNIDTMKELSRLTGYQYYTFFKTIKLSTNGEYGVAVLSKYPIVDSQRYDLPSEGVEDRVLGRTVIDVNGHKVNFFVTHVSYENKDSRTKQLIFINDVLGQYDNFLLTGDFNTSDFTEYALFNNAGTLNTAENHLPTYQKKDSIDNFVYSLGDWTFEGPNVFANDHSDHSMLYSKGTFQPEK